MKNFSPNHSALEPATADELSELVKEFHSKKEEWHPYGYGSRLDWGAPILPSSKALSIKNFNRVIEHSIDDLTITVEAGASLAELQLSLQETNQWLAIDWPSGSKPTTDIYSAGTIGGLVARGLSGSLRHKYMAVRDQIIGIGIMRTDGVSAKAGGKVVKNVAGYDLMRLLCGSWGGLALITQLTLRTQAIKKSHIVLNIKGKLTELESLRIKLLNTSFSPEYFDWLIENKNHISLEIGLASLSQECIKDQLRNINLLSNEYKVFSNTKDWNGPLLSDKELSLDLKKSYWLIRISLLPSKIHNLISSNELKNLKDFNWRISASLGVGEGWEESKSNENLSSKLNQIKALRSKVEAMRGELVILNQPKFINNKLDSWKESNSKHIIEKVKSQFDPLNQLSVGRLPGTAG